MVSFVDSSVDGGTISGLAVAFVLLTGWAWLASPGLSVAIGCYGATLTSEHLYRFSRSSTSRSGRFFGLLGVALSWLLVLAFAAAVLPSNFSAALI